MLSSLHQWCISFAAKKVLIQGSYAFRSGIFEGSDDGYGNHRAKGIITWMMMYAVHSGLILM